MDSKPPTLVPPSPTPPPLAPENPQAFLTAAAAADKPEGFQESPKPCLCPCTSQEKAPYKRSQKQKPSKIPTISKGISAISSAHAPIKASNSLSNAPQVPDEKTALEILTELNFWKGSAKTVGDKIKNGTWDFTREELKIFLRQAAQQVEMSLTVGKGSHQGVKFSTDNNSQDPREWKVLNLPNWDKKSVFVKPYLRTPILTSLSNILSKAQTMEAYGPKIQALLENHASQKTSLAQKRHG